MTRGRRRNESRAATRRENNIPSEIHQENASPEIPPPTKKHDIPPHNRSSNSTSIHANPRISSTAFQQPQILHFERSSCPTSDTGKPAAVQSIGLGLGLSLRLTEEVKVAIFGGTKVCTKSDLSATQVQDMRLRSVFFASSFSSMSSFSFASIQARKGPALDEPRASSLLVFHRTYAARLQINDIHEGS